MSAAVAGLDRRTVEDAAAALAPYVERTPLVRSDAFSDMTGSEVFLKLDTGPYEH